ncbi:MAG TPA: REDY-like protein HapK [Stenotrophomonas sp.]|nr:REDY-like protein HapK [Stenotrophomonas sp.]
MQTIVVLFNLKPGVIREEYEAWARDSDLPVVNGLASVDGFEVLKASGLLIGDGPSPYEYVELIRVPDMAAFAADLADPAAQAGAAQFQQKYADNPLFILASAL